MAAIPNKLETVYQSVTPATKAHHSVPTELWSSLSKVSLGLMAYKAERRDTNIFAKYTVQSIKKKDSKNRKLGRSCRNTQAC